MKLFKITWGTGTYMLQTAVATGYHEQDAVDTLIDYLYDNQLRSAFVKEQDFEWNGGGVYEDMIVTGGRHDLCLNTNGQFDMIEITDFGEWDDDFIIVF